MNVNGELLDGKNFDKVFGPEVEGLHFLPLNNIIIAGQYRSRYEKQDQEELAESINKENLQNPVLVCEMTASEAAEYLAYTNRVWNAKVDLNTFTPNQRSNFYVLVAGHKRTLAMRQIAEDQSLINPATAAFVTRDKSILQVMKLQGVENIHRAPIPQDKANLINQMYIFGMEKGIYSTVTEFVNDSPFSAHETYAALRYVVLPEEVKVLVDKGHMAYSTAVNLYPLYEAIYERLVFKGTPPHEIAAKLEADFVCEVRYFITLFPRMTLSSIQTMLQNKIVELTSGQTQFDMLHQSFVESVRKAAPAIAMIKRSSENIQSILNIISDFGGISGWNASAPVLDRAAACDTIAINLKILERLQFEAEPGNSLPGLDELIKESQNLLFSIS